MVKLVFAFAMLFASIINTNTHASFLNKQKWYLGVNSGTLNCKDIFCQYKNVYKNTYRNIINNMLEINSSMFFGYKINPYVNLEVLSHIIGKFPNHFQFKIPKLIFSDIEYTTKFILPVTKKILLYSKVGVITTPKKTEKIFNTVRELNGETRRVSPFFASGIQCLLNNKMYIDFGYQVKKSILDLLNLDINSILDGLNFSISWRFEADKINSDIYNIIHSKKNTNKKSKMQNLSIFVPSKKDYFI